MASTIEILVDHDASSTTPSDVGFLRVQRLTLRTRYLDGTLSEPYRYDVVERAALDAVLIVLHTPDVHDPDNVRVCLRTALRPPVALRGVRVPAVPVKDHTNDPMLWELPAGLIEQSATGLRGVFETAARETEEEAGYSLAPQAFSALGRAVYLTPGMCGEKLHVVRAVVDPEGTPARVRPSGEVVEVPSLTRWTKLSEALEWADRGQIEDCKTELALRRLRGILSASSAEPRETR